MKNRKQMIKMIAVIPAALILTGCGRTAIDVNDYVDIECEGADTKGTATCTVDFARMVEDNLELFGLDEANEVKQNGIVTNIESNLTGKLDKEEELSNGDTVTFKWDDSGLEKLEKRYKKVKFNVSDKAMEVTDLEVPEEFDPFEYLTVNFEGYAPNGEAILSASDLPVSGIKFTADKTEGLSNGDVVKVTFGDADCEELCFEQGYVPTATENEYTVEGLTSYIQNIDDVTEDAFNKMDSHAQDVLKAHVADKWVNKNGLKKIELIGNYLLTPKDPSIYTSLHDKLYFVYKVTAKDETKPDDDKAEFSYYYYSSYSEITLLPDGTCSFDLGSIETPIGSWFTSGADFKRGDLIYYGYEDLDSLFNNLITANIDSYNYESTVEE